MDVKDFFQKIRHIDEQIDIKVEHLEQLKALATKVTATMSETSSQRSGVSRSMENSVDKIITLQEELNADIDRYIDMKRSAGEIIRQIQNEKYRRVLESRYLLGKTWEAIAAEMDMTYQGVCRIHGRALQEAEKFFPELVDS